MNLEEALRAEEAVRVVPKGLPRRERSRRIAAWVYAKSRSAWRLWRFRDWSRIDWTGYQARRTARVARA